MGKKRANSVGITGKRGPKTEAGKKRSLANLRSPWVRGESGNPEGRKPAGATVKEWWNVLQDSTKAELEEIAKNPDAPAAKVAAARDWLTAISEDRNTSGIPINGGATERIIDYTEGKPTQRTDVTSNGETVKQFVNVNVDDV